MNAEVVIEVLKHTLMITGVVMLVMLIIEYLNVQTKGRWSVKLKASPWMQILIAGLLGIIPGCLGTFTAVSLFSHQIMNFAALVAQDFGNKWGKHFRANYLFGDYRY